MNDGHPGNIAELALLAGYNVQGLWPPQDGDAVAAPQQPYEVLLTVAQGLLLTPEQAAAARDQPAALEDAGPDLEDALFATLRDVLLETTRPLTYLRSQACGDCSGTGLAAVRRGQRSGRPNLDDVGCLSCGGARCTMTLVRQVVTVCGATGTKIATLQGAAGGGKAGLASIGDVDLMLHVAEHPAFKFRGGSSFDLQTVKYITLKQARSGAALDVELLGGLLHRLTTTPGRRWVNPEMRKIENEGLPIVGGQLGERGDLYVRVTTSAPPRASWQLAEQAAQKATQAHHAVAEAAQRFLAAAEAMTPARPPPGVVLPQLAQEMQRRQQILRCRPQLLLAFQLQSARADVLEEQAVVQAALQEQRLAERRAAALAAAHWSRPSKWLLRGGIAASLALLAVGVLAWNRQCPHAPVEAAPGSGSSSGAAAPTAMPCTPAPRWGAGWGREMASC